MNLGKMIRSGRAVDDFTVKSKMSMHATPSVKAELAVAPVTVEKIVYVDKVVESVGL